VPRSVCALASALLKTALIFEDSTE